MRKVICNKCGFECTQGFYILELKQAEYSGYDLIINDEKEIFDICPVCKFKLVSGCGKFFTIYEENT